MVAQAEFMEGTEISKAAVGNPAKRMDGAASKQQKTYFK